jgi:hypothetical protein
MQAFTRTFTYWLNQERWRQLKALVLEDPGKLTFEEKDTIIKLKKIYRIGFIFTVASYYSAVFIFSVIAAFSSNEFEMPLNFQIPFTKYLLNRICTMNFKILSIPFLAYIHIQLLIFAITSAFTTKL